MYNDQPISSKSPPTRDKIHPEVKAQARIRSRNRNGQDAVDAGMIIMLRVFLVTSIRCLDEKNIILKS